MKLILAARSYANHIAIVDNSQQYSYSNLLNESEKFAHVLLRGKTDLLESRVAFMVEPGFDYVKVQWAIWRAGGIAVPLCLTHPLPSLQYVLEDTQASIVVVSPAFESILESYAIKNDLHFIVLNKLAVVDSSGLPEVASSRAALILYTSGTTNKPKGVLLTHNNLEAQMENLIQAWEWNSNDHVLSVLPLHHIHGIVNVIGCSLLSGATCSFIDSFSAEQVFELFAKGQINVFMAVPTVYYKLIAYWETLTHDQQTMYYAKLQAFRLMVCGSAALPVTIMDKWKTISGHTLLERYGMTEIGMGISNPYIGERRPGHVGVPLPNVSIRLVDEKYQDVANGEQGEILVKGENVFKAYWQKPIETQKEFTEDGWFKTGDVAVLEDGYYRIVGRSSVDIIKSGGYKISALEIEEVLRNHIAINDCAVVGVPDEEWGEKVVAAVEANQVFDTGVLNAWMKESLPSYKVPKQYLVVHSLPRNAMGKVVKNDIKKLFIK